MRKIPICFVAFIFFTGISFAQKEQAPYIKSAAFEGTNKALNTTFVPLGTPLVFSFDDLEADQKTYEYKIEHMSFDWKPSSLFSNEYIDGFQQQTIQEYENSFNTLQDYTHYKIEIPNSTLKIKKSGNYQISIIDPLGNIVLKRRFTYYENLVQIAAKALRSKISGQSLTDQGVEFTINHPQLRFNNPSEELKIALVQNNNWQTVITQFDEPYYKRNQLVYNTNSGGNFKGGNEFLNFDNKAISATNLKIQKVEKKQIYHHILHQDEPRANKPYTYSPDINGAFLVRALNSSSVTEADYARIYFSLKTQDLKDQKIYVYGAFNNYATGLENEMHYNKETDSYTASLLLKQGFYNYNYISLDNKNKPNLTAFSGSFYQTENSYTLLVYYRPMNSDFDRVIGGQTFFFKQTQ